MPLKYQIEKETDVPEEHKKIYVEREVDGTNGNKVKIWILDVDGVVPKEKLTEFRTTNQKLTEDNRKLSEKYADIDDPDKARQLIKICKDIDIAKAEEVLKKGGVDGIVEARTKAMKDDYEKKLRDQTEKATSWQARHDRVLVDNEIMQACGKFSLHPGAEVSIVRLADGLWTVQNGKVVSLDSGGQPRPSKDGTSNLSVSEWLADDLLKKHSYLIKDSQGAGGSGSGGGGGGGGGDNVNPWKKETLNLTQQMIITKKDPAKAERLRQAAGK